MILEALGVLVVVLGKRVVADIATNIENRIINAAIEAVNQKQEPSLTELGMSISNLQKKQDDLQEKQDEMMAVQIRQIKVYYKDGIAALRYANRATHNKQKKVHIRRAIDCFTSASNVEVGEATIEAALFVGASFYALRRIDRKTSIGLENGEYERAFQLALAYRRSDGKPPLDLIEKLLQLPYLRERYGTFEVYRSQWEPKLIEAPPKLLPSPLSSQSLRSKSRLYPSSSTPPSRRNPSSSTPPSRRNPSSSTPPSRRNPSSSTPPITCAMCKKEFVVTFLEAIYPGNVLCPECISKLP